MEILNIKNSRNSNLVAHLYTTSSKSIIVLSHGFKSDKYLRGDFNLIIESLHSLGYNILTFDYSGCGESDDGTITVAKQVDDLNSILNYVKSAGYEKVGLIGCSLGGLNALKCYSPLISTMVLWAPVTDKIKYTWDKRYSPEQLLEFEEKGHITVEKFNRKMLIDKEFLYERENVNQKELVMNVKCPVLIIHGNEDLTVPLTDSVSAINLLPSSKLEIVEGADHYFTGKNEIIVDLTVNWFLSHLEK
jgi:pimeloyl-ACP methyl ester carboxylesterase